MIVETNMTLIPGRMETSRLILRDFVTDDFRAVHDYASDPQIVRFMSFGPNTEDETRAFLARVAARQAENPRTAYDFAVTLKTGELIGGCGLFVKEHESGYIGYCFARPYWGRGFASETAAALVDFGFERLHLHRVFARCDAENHASQKVLRRAGMRLEGHLRECVRIRGEWRDDLIFAILRTDWELHRAAP